MGKISLDNSIELYGKQEAVIICRSDRLETINDQSGFILGNSSFNINAIPRHLVTMESGDFMIMYTDGVTELENSVGETIGISGMLQYIQPNVDLFRSLKASQICQEIVDFLAMWGADNIEDDITILVIKRL
jgi:sigma-B regulation protein RsbU (phosphoserine phosphatase)